MDQVIPARPFLLSHSGSLRFSVPMPRAPPSGHSTHAVPLAQANPKGILNQALAWKDSIEQMTVAGWVGGSPLWVRLSMKSRVIKAAIRQKHDFRY